MGEDNKIIACIVRDGQRPGTSEVEFIGKNGYVAGVGLDKVISANVVGDQIVVMCESQLTKNRWINIYDAYTCRQINVLPA